MNWMDIAIISIIVFNGISGMTKGFIIAAFNLLGYILAALIARMYYPMVSNLIMEKTDLFNKINNRISQNIADIFQSSGNPETFNSIIEHFKLPKILEQGMSTNPNVQGQISNLTNPIANQMANTLTEMFINIISIILVFIIVRILLIIVINILDNIAKLPILNTMNRTAGLILGLAKGVLLVLIIFTVLTPVIMFSPDGVIASTTYNSFFGEYFYTNNIIMDFLNAQGYLN